MSERAVPVTGRDGLAVLTRLLQRVRLEHPTAGIWEAADLHWWWRSPRASDDLAQTVWLDDGGEPVAACVFTAWQESWTCDPIVLPSRADDLLPVVMAAAGVRLGAGEVTGDVVMAVPDGDGRWRRLAEQHGLAAGEDQWAVLWMDAASASTANAAPSGYRLTDRSERAELPHHFTRRSSGDVAARLSASPLYRPDLDLCVVTDDGEVAAYGLFWFDPVTRVGMVEPMRTEDTHQGRGLARAVLTTGLSRLAATGAERLKVSVEVGNAPAEHLYTSVGFVPTRIDTGFVRHIA